MATHATTWFGVMATSAGSISIGTAVVPGSDGKYYPATSANRTSYGRAVGIAIRAASSSNPTFEIQVAGPLSASVTGLAAGTESWVRVSATGTLERCTPASGDDLIGKCSTTGRLYAVAPGVWDADNFAGGGVGGDASYPIDLTNAAQVTVPAAGVVKSNGSVLSSSDVDLTTDVTGTLPVANIAAGTKSYILESFDSGAGAAVRWGLRDRPTITNTGTGTLDDVATTDANGNQAEIIRWTGNGADTATITSLAGPTQSRVIVIINASAGDDPGLTLSHAAVTGTAANRLSLPGNTALTIGVGYAAVLRYDATTSIWQLVGGTALAKVLTDDLQTQIDDLDFSVAGLTDLGAGFAALLTAAAPSGSLVGTSATQTLSNKTVFDNSFTIADDSDTTKKAQFQCSGITTGTTRTMTVPNADGTLALLGLAQTFSALQTFSAGAAFGAAPMATEGEIRFGYSAAAGPSIRGLNSALAANAYLVHWQADSMYIGTGSAFSAATQVTNISMYCHSAGAFGIGLGGGTFLYLVGSRTESWVPRLGSVIGSTPYASEGRATQAMADADQVAAAAIYSRKIIMCTGALTAPRTLTFPHPASEDASYEKVIYANVSGNNVVVSTGTGGTVTVTPGIIQHVMMTPSGVTAI